MIQSFIKNVLLPMVLVLVCLFSTANVFAHSKANKSVPADKAIIEKDPTEARVWLTEKIEPKLSGITVVNAKGQAVHTGVSLISDDRLQLAVALKKLDAGVYTASWHVVSVDGHATKGTFSFTIKSPSKP